MKQYFKILLMLLLTTITWGQDSLVINNAKPNLHKPSGKNIYSKSNSLLKIKMNKRIFKLDKVFLPKIIDTKNYFETKQKFIDSDLFYISIGTSLLFGTAAAYFKIESDNYYNKYKSTGKKSFLHKTDNYDLYSGLALGALELNFGYLIYKFLTD